MTPCLPIEWGRVPESPVSVVSVFPLGTPFSSVLPGESFGRMRTDSGLVRSSCTANVGRPLGGGGRTYGSKRVPPLRRGPQTQSRATTGQWGSGPGKRRAEVKTVVTKLYPPEHQKQGWVVGFVGKMRRSREETFRPSTLNSRPPKDRRRTRSPLTTEHSSP